MTSLLPLGVSSSGERSLERVGMIRCFNYLLTLMVVFTSTEDSNWSVLQGNFTTFWKRRRGALLIYNSSCFWEVMQYLPARGFFSGSKS